MDEREPVSTRRQMNRGNAKNFRRHFITRHFFIEPCRNSFPAAPAAPAACGVVFYVGLIKRVARIHRNRRWIHAFGVLSTLPIRLQRGGLLACQFS